MYMKYNKNFLHDHIVSVFDSAMSCEYLIVLKSSESQIFLCEKYALNAEYAELNYN